MQVATAASAGVELIVLPELFSLPYFCQTQDTHYFDLAQPLNGPTALALKSWASEYQVVIVGSIFEKRAPGIYHNTALVFDKDQGLAGIYRKMHIPDDPGFNEKFYFTPGDSTNHAFAPIKTSVGTLGVLICWDQWFPEAARLSCLQGAQMLIYPTAIGYNPEDDAEEQNTQLNAWVQVQVGHAIANQVPVLSVNRVGFESAPNTITQHSGIEFWGNTFISDARGTLLTRAGTKQHIVTAALDLSQTETTRRIWPFLRDRRIECYQDLSKRFIKPYR